VGPNRSIPPHVAQRLGRGNAGAGGDAPRQRRGRPRRPASRSARKHRFVLSQLNRPRGPPPSATHRPGDLLTPPRWAQHSRSSVGTVSRSQTSGEQPGPRATGPPGAARAGLAPRSGSDSTEASESPRPPATRTSLTDGINTSTILGWSPTVRGPIGAQRVARADRSSARGEFLVETGRNCKRLPAERGDRQLRLRARGGTSLLADANPAIAKRWSTVTWRSLDEARLATESEPRGCAGGAGRRAWALGAAAQPPPETSARPPEPPDLAQRRRRWTRGPTPGPAGRPCAPDTDRGRAGRAGRLAAGCCYGHSTSPCCAGHQPSAAATRSHDGGNLRARVGGRARPHRYVGDLTSRAATCCSPAAKGGHRRRLAARPGGGPSRATWEFKARGGSCWPAPT